MKYIKEYKIFEMHKNELLSDVKECFLPVLDMDMNDDVTLYFDDDDQIVEINIPITPVILFDVLGILYTSKLDARTITEEICNSISHCIGMGMYITKMHIHWLAKKGEEFSKPALNFDYKLGISKTSFSYFPLYTYPEFHQNPLQDDFYIEVKIVNHYTNIDEILDLLSEKSDKLTHIKIAFDRR